VTLRWNARAAMIVLALLLAACGGAASQAVASAKPTPTPVQVTSDQLLAYTAKAVDLGAGWTESPTPGATSVGTDIISSPCHYAFVSDAERLARNSVTITNDHDRSYVESDVTYFAYHGAKDLMSDLRTILKTCPTYTEQNSEGATVTIDERPSAVSSVTSLGDDRVGIDRRATLGAQSIYSVLLAVRVGQYVTTIFSLSGDPAEAGRIAGLAAVASTMRLKSAPH
jgi:hypothetical protein